MVYPLSNFDLSTCKGKLDAICAVFNIYRVLACLSHNLPTVYWPIGSAKEQKDGKGRVISRVVSYEGKSRLRC